MEKSEEVIPEALVIGAGIAGMQAALDIADKGFKVHLVEKESCIGGHMAQLDKTFPTLDCSACISTPKMVDTANHPNINLLDLLRDRSGRRRTRAFQGDGQEETPFCRCHQMYGLRRLRSPMPRHPPQ